MPGMEDTGFTRKEKELPSAQESCIFLKVVSGRWEEKLMLNANSGPVKRRDTM